MVKEKVNNFENMAKGYDNIYNVYTDDIKFYIKEANKIKGAILEIACGTGRIYLELLKRKKDVYGIDISKNMLIELEKKAKKLNLNPKVYRQNMKNIKIRKKFDLVIIPFRSFLHNLTIEDQVKTLRGIKKILKKNGKLILNFFYPNPELLSKTKSMGKNRGTSYINIPNQTIEFSEGIFRYRYAFIYKREFELLLMFAGFKNWKVYGDFNYNSLKNYKQEMVWIVKK